jgi:hypothetical protein
LVARNFDEDRDRRLEERRALWVEEKRDRGFVLGGETFEYAETIPFSTIELISQITEAPSDAAYIRTMSRALPSMIDLGDDPEATLARLERAKTAVEFADVEALCFWILGEYGRRPTQAPSLSGERRETNGTGSTEPSSSPPAASVASGG